MSNKVIANSTEIIQHVYLNTNAQHNLKVFKYAINISFSTNKTFIIFLC